MNDSRLAGTLRCSICEKEYIFDDNKDVIECATCDNKIILPQDSKILTVPGGSKSLQEQQQEEFHDSVTNTAESLELELTRPYNTYHSYEFLMLYKLRLVLALLQNNGLSLSLNNMLSVGCGNGFDIDFFIRHGAKEISGLDISYTALEVAEKRMKYQGFDDRLSGLFHSSAKNMPFSENSYDIVYAHDALHHLEKPMKTLDSMFKIARKAVFIIEGNNSVIMRFFTKMGVAVEYEESGNKVIRFKREEIEEVALNNGFTVFIAEYVAIKYWHNPQKNFYKIMDKPMNFWLLKKMIPVLSRLAGSQANHIIFLAIQDDSKMKYSRNSQ